MNFVSMFPSGALVLISARFPSMMKRCFGRVVATLNRFLFPANRRPPVSVLTVLKMIVSRSRPWNPSTVEISKSPYSGSASSMRLRWPRYGVMMPRLSWETTSCRMKCVTSFSTASISASLMVPLNRRRHASSPGTSTKMTGGPLAIAAGCDSTFVRGVQSVLLGHELAVVILPS